jgi:CcmD family protein
MRRLSLLLVLGVLLGAGTAAADSEGSAGSAAPAAGSAAAPAPGPAGSAPAAGSAPTAPPADPAPAGDPGQLRKTCVAAMNTNDTFARAMIQWAIDTQRMAVNLVCADADTVKSHQDAVHHIEKNERHVFIAYAAIWLIAAGFLFYMFQRQQRLKAEIAQLRRELEDAAKDTKEAK